MKPQTKIRAGFALVEVIIAIVIISIAIVALFSSISYALLVTVEARGYATAHAKAENAGFLSVAKKDILSVSDPDIGDIQLPPAANDWVSLTIAAKNDDGTTTPKQFEIRVAAYKEAPHSRKMKSPASVVFLNLRKE
jgi:prepilin-type N-terminal cleavage/methylation domain-containing protein